MRPAEAIVQPDDLELVEDLLSAGKILIITTDPDGKITDIKGDALGLIGYDRDEVIGNLQQQRTLYSVKTRAQLKQKLARVKEGHKLEEEIEILYQGCAPRRFFIRGRKIEDHGGRCVGIKVIATDITREGKHSPPTQDLASHERAEAFRSLYKLNRELARHSSIRDVATHLLPVLHAELGCRRLWLGVMNDFGTHIVGQSAFGPGMTPRIARVQIDLSLPHYWLDAAMSEGRPAIVDPGDLRECSGLTRIIHRLNPTQLVIAPLVALDHRVGVLVVEPEGDPERLLNLLQIMAGEIATSLVARRFDAKMAEADKMQMASLLSSGVAHNFNNLLQAIGGNASLIELCSRGSTDVSRYAKDLHDIIEKGSSLVRQLRAVTGPTREALKVANLTEALTREGERWRRLLGKVELELLVDEDWTIPVPADEAQLVKALSQIVINSKEAIERIGETHGRVLLTARRVYVGSGEVNFELPPGRYARIDIEDNGGGMDSTTLARCFEPFFTTKESDATGVGYGGVGLGLSYVYSFARAHRGAVIAKSGGGGTIVSLYLPLVDPNALSTCRGTVAIVGFPHNLGMTLREEVKRIGFEAALLPDLFAQGQSFDFVLLRGGDTLSPITTLPAHTKILVLSPQPAERLPIEGRSIDYIDESQGLWYAALKIKRILLREIVRRGES